MPVTIRNKKLFCTCCGGEFTLNYPVGIQEMVDKSEAFTKLHTNCKQTWIEPKVDQSKAVQQKAMWWIENGERGLSSKTMWNLFMRNKSYAVNHPYDPDDFSRCYKLLEAVPEWKERVPELCTLSKEWKNLADNWDVLTAMYKENVKTNWKNYKQIGMYEFMEELIK